jgi:glycosyltransferase involved in cell wall biosynthesis
MKIAVNTRFLLKNKLEGFGWFTYETVKRMVLSNPQHDFYFFFDRPYDEKFIFADNVTAMVLKPPARHPILFKIWFNKSVSRALNQVKADLFFSPDGFLSLKTEVPQVAVIHDLNFEHHPEDLPRSARNYLKKYFPLFAKKAAHIITVSNYSKQDIIRTYGIEESKITVAHNGGSELYRPIPANERVMVQAEFADSEDYFVYVGALHARKNISRMLRAFNQFKKQTNSPMKFVIVGERLWNSQLKWGDFEELEFAEDVNFTGHLPIEKLSKVVASAKALVLVSYFEGFGIPVVEAMRAGTAVVCGNKTSLPEVAGNAAVLVDPYSIDDIAYGLQRIDENEDLRESLIQAGLVRATEFDWDKSADIIWSVLSDLHKRSK